MEVRRVTVHLPRDQTRPCPRRIPLRGGLFRSSTPASFAGPSATNVRYQRENNPCDLLLSTSTIGASDTLGIRPMRRGSRAFICFIAGGQENDRSRPNQLFLREDPARALRDSRDCESAAHTYAVWLIRYFLDQMKVVRAGLHCKLEVLGAWRLASLLVLTR